MGAATAIRLAAGLLLNKVFALYVGPAGLALIGQLGNLAGIVNGVATGGVGAGVTRYVAEHGGLRGASRQLSAALAIVATTSIIVSLAVAIAARPLASRLLGSPEWTWIVWVLAAVSLIAALNSLIVAALTGMKRISAVAGIATASTVVALGVTIPLTVRFGLLGALLGACLAPALQSLAALAYVGARRPLLAGLALAGPGRDALLRMARYSAMSLSAAITGPLAVLLVRDHLGTALSWREAGYWQGIWKLSEIYLSLAASVLSVHFLPRLAEHRDPASQRRELRRGLATVVPAVAAAACAIWLLRDWIVRSLFSEAFQPMTNLFTFQLVGDVLKIASWVLAYLLLAKAMTAAYIVTEFAFAASFYLLAVVLVGRFGLVGATYAYALNYLTYLITIVLVVRHALKKRPFEPV
jgi:polysaccharide transporter, PST family